MELGSVTLKINNQHTLAVSHPGANAVAADGREWHSTRAGVLVGAEPLVATGRRAAEYIGGTATPRRSVLPKPGASKPGAFLVTMPAQLRARSHVCAGGWEVCAGGGGAGAAWAAGAASGSLPGRLCRPGMRVRSA